MRHGRLVLATGIAIACGVGLHQGWFARAYDHVTTSALSEEALLAMDLGCRGHKNRAAQQCRARLKKLYLARSLDPDKTLRAWCQSVEHAHWGGSRPAPPELCVERYGGWPEG